MKVFTYQSMKTVFSKAIGRWGLVIWITQCIVVKTGYSISGLCPLWYWAHNYKLKPYVLRIHRLLCRRAQTLPGLLVLAFQLQPNSNQKYANVVHTWPLLSSTWASFEHLNRNCHSKWLNNIIFIKLRGKSNAYTCLESPISEQHHCYNYQTMKQSSVKAQC